LTYDDSLAPAYTVLGAVSLEARQPEEALPDLEQAIALDATYGPAYFYLGLVYKSLEQPEKAIAAFEQALITAGSEDTRNKIRRHLDELYGADGQGTVP
jgi:tetratricopeptide (TPR) repeat protein